MEQPARPLRILLVADEAAGAQLLRALARGPHRLAGVVAGDGGEPAPAGVAGLARRLDLPLWPAAAVRSPGFAATAAACEADLLLNVHSLHVIRPEVLAVARIGAFNLHPGPLPRYAGLNGPSWAVYRGERMYGVTVHWMDAGIDTGDIAYQTTFAIGETDTGLTVAARCAKLGLALMLGLVEQASADPAAIPRLRPDRAAREYLGRQVPDEGRLRWARPARAVLAFVRACDYHPFPSPWGHPRTRLADREVAILKAEPTGEPAGAEPGTVCERVGGAVTVACADERILVSHLVLDGRPLPAADLLQPGQRLVDGR